MGEAIQYKVKRLDLRILVETEFEPNKILTYLFSLDTDDDSTLSVSVEPEYDEVMPLGIMRRWEPTSRLNLSIEATKCRPIDAFPVFCPIAYVLDDPIEVVRCFIEAPNHSSHEGTASNGSTVTW